MKLHVIYKFRHLIKDNSKHTKIMIIRTKVDSVYVDKY